MIPILHEDSFLAVCLKPPGLLSQDGPGGSLPEALRQQLHSEIYPVHRLDREAGGVMVYAKTGRAAAALSRAIREGSFQKEYLCVVSGCPAQPSGTYRDLLLHDRTRNKSFVVSRPRGGVREAVLGYTVLDSRDGLSLVRVTLHTGRTHQIRVQFASRGTPLAGDRKYGGGSAAVLALWSARVAFPHPADGKRAVFQAAPAGEIWEKFPAARSGRETDPAADGKGSAGTALT